MKKLLGLFFVLGIVFSGSAFSQEQKNIEVIAGSFLVERYQEDPSSNRVRNWKNYEPQVGDILVCASTDKTMRCLFKVMTGEFCTHTVMVVRGSDGALKVLNAEKTERVKLLRIEEYLNLGGERIWVRQVVKPLSLEASQKLTRFAEAQEGKPYALFRRLWKIPFSTPIVSEVAEELRLDELFAGEEWFCSELVVTAAQVAGLLSKHVCPLSTAPGDLFHLRCNSWGSPREWSNTLIFCKAP